MRNAALSIKVYMFFAVFVMCVGPVWAQGWARGLFPQQDMSGKVGDWPSTDARAMCEYRGELYVGGNFTTVDEACASCIAKWNGSSWQNVGVGMNYTIYCLCVYKDELYAGGYFTTADGSDAKYIAKWNGTTWQSVGAGFDASVRTLCVYKGELYAGGNFTTSGGASVSRIARWDGTSWKSVGTAKTSGIWQMCVFDGELYVSGSLDDINGETPSLARWDGASWHSVYTQNNVNIGPMCVYDNDLYVAGSYNADNGAVVNYVAKYHSGSWQTVANTEGGVYMMCVYNGELYCGGHFFSVGAVVSKFITRWNGSTWQTMSTGINGNYITALYVYKNELYLGGDFTTIGGTSAKYIAKWDNTSWHKVIGDMSYAGINGSVYALCVYNNDLYVAGSFTSINGISLSHIAKWNGKSWQSVGSGTDSTVYSLCVYNGQLYTAGTFTHAGGVDAYHVARWDGECWHGVGTQYDGNARTMCFYNGNPYVAGKIVLSSGGFTKPVFKWNGETWQSMGQGIGLDVYMPMVYTLCAYNGDLYAGGTFMSGGGEDAEFVAKWDGAAWRTVGNELNSSVYSLCVCNGELYAGGAFDTGYYPNCCESEPILNPSGIAKWDGTTWQSLGTGITGTVMCMHGCNNDVYVGGGFIKAGGVDVSNIAKWNGTTWQGLGSGINGRVNAICAYDDHRGSGSAIYVGGQFTIAGGNVSVNLARWGNERAISDFAAIKQANDGALVNITDCASTAVFGDTFYVEKQDRSSGIRVDLPGNSIAQGRRVSVLGRIRTSTNGERYISALHASDTGELEVKPLAMNLKALGGGSMGLQDGVCGWIRSTGSDGKRQRVRGQESGLNNLGLLVHCSGKLTPDSQNSFYIDDGSELVLVNVPSDVSIDPNWQYVSVTGISSCIKGASGLERLIRIRRQKDITAE